MGKRSPAPIKHVLIALSILTTWGVFHANANEYSDGPYASVNGKSLDLQWVYQGEKYAKSIKKASLPFRFDQHGLRANIHTLAFPENETLTFNGNFPVAAFSDLHGRYDLMLELLTENGIIDKRGHWNFKKGHFVVTGDVFDRGDQVTEILWFLFRLDKEAEEAGGKLHLLLGNHEVLVLNGQLGYLHEKYKKTAEILDVPFQQLFTAETVLGNWLRSKPVLVRINNMLFTHGGFHPELAQEKRSLKNINKTFKSSLVNSELNQPRNEWEKYLHGGKGPVWYRGYFKDDGATTEEIDLLLKHFDVDHIVVGHTSQKKILIRYEGKVIAIDSSIKNGKYGEILFIDGKKIWRGSPTGDTLPLD